MAISELLILHHTHTDIGYTNPQPVFWRLSRQFIDQAIDLCQATAQFPEDARMRWTCEVTSTVLHWLDSASSARIEQMRSLVAAGQIAFGAMWCHWSATVREDVLHESLLPVRRLREELGAPVAVAIAHDVNGLPWSAVEMLLDAGVEGLLTGVNIHFGGYPLQRPMPFRWVGASGRSLPVFSGEHYNTFNRIAKPQLGDIDRMQAGIDKYLLRLRAKGYALPFAFLTATHPFCDDNNPPYAELPALVRRWNDAGRTPRLRLIAPETLFRRLRDLPADAILAYAGDWTDYWTFGSGSAALELQAARAGHDALWDARLLQATAAKSMRWDNASETQAVFNLALADEHTFGAYCSTAGLQTSPRYEPIPVAEQWYPKAAAMFAGLSLGRMLRRDALDDRAENPTDFAAAEGLLVVNPAQIARRVCLRIPRRLLDHTEPVFNTALQKLDVAGGIDNDPRSQWIGPVDLPPMSSRTIPLSDVKNAIADPRTSASTTSVESKWYTLTIDSDTGRILSLKDRRAGLELADTKAHYGLFDAINETIAESSSESKRLGDPRLNIFNASMENYDRVHDDVDCWIRDWPAKRMAARCLRFETNVSALGAVLTRELSCPGVNGSMIQTITLCGHEPRVMFEVYFNKADVHEPEAVYFAFPFSVPKAQAWFDTAGQAVAFDREQLPGVCRDFVTADSYIAAAGEDRCITLACPDAPLFQIGAMNFGRGIRSVAGLNQATLFAWPMNNYWNTNFRVSQPGFVGIKFEMTTFAEFDPAACALFAGSSSHPVVWHPMASCRSDQTQSLIRIDDRVVTLVQMKRAADGQSIVVRLRNHSSAAVETSFELPAMTIQTAHLSDSLEYAGNALSVHERRVRVPIPARSTATVLVTPTT